jgi:AraC-like DNA-binding protein
MQALSNVRQSLSSGERLSRHRHPYPYAAVVLAGAYREAGSGGRFRVRSGEVMFHDAFEAHLNSVEPAGAVILNIPMSTHMPMSPRIAGGAHFSVADVDALAAMAERDLSAAAQELVDSLVALPAPLGDWPDLLAADLRRNAVPCLADWSARHGLTPHALSRGFRAAFGVTPKRFGLECKAHAALRRIRVCGDSLCSIAMDSGFSDQAHMTRTVADITGSPPSRWQTPLRAPSPCAPSSQIRRAGTCHTKCR